MDFWQSLFPKNPSHLTPNEWQKWLQNYMNQAFTNHMVHENKEAPQSSSSSTNYQIFEAFHFIYVHVILTDSLKEHLKVHHTLSELTIHFSSETHEDLRIQLPAPVSKKGATAEIKDLILEVCLTKLKNQYETELSIESID
ncbi:Hsp20/alpha crystallin family protein [Jeotgalibacillus soli]|uniref:Uncharacterized protein n=1 Tax=Jeotgalibacillus soli TaxID=889306 RepID=A0A0C2RUT4_9BACL|nr:Hsp20/alpha crystallin family protein [Jeotgalibacillus soli]KIL45489.1 hypothetical protein KP78_30330 [Jeotgalibacillus soli]